MTLPMARHITSVGFLLSALVGCFIYQIKHRVLDLEKAMQGVNREIIQTNEGIHILKAEWGYLNQPKRLETLNDKYLNLKPIKHIQVASYKSLPTVIASRPSGSKMIIAHSHKKTLTT